MPQMLLAERPTTLPNIEAHFTVLSGRAVVEMIPRPEQVEGLFRYYRRYKPWQEAKLNDLLRARLLTPATVKIKRGKEWLQTTVPAGATVLINHADGKRIKGFKAGEYAPEEEVRLLGIVCKKWGAPLKMPLGETIMATVIDTDQGCAYRPEFGNILLDLPPLREVTEGGIHLPDVCKDRPWDYAKVLAVGPLCEYVKKGDTVTFERRALFELGFDGNPSYALIDEDGIYIIHEDEAA